MNIQGDYPLINIKRLADQDWGLPVLFLEANLLTAQYNIPSRVYT